MTDKHSPLHDFHLKHGGKMVSFAGYQMPVQYEAGVLKEHLHCRSSASLFDVSHMGQVAVMPAKNMPAQDGGQFVAALLEAVLPSNIINLKLDHMRYSTLLSPEGGIVDDLIVTQRGSHCLMVLNASRKVIDLAYLSQLFQHQLEFKLLEDAALLALQGPKAVEVLSRYIPAVETMGFMSVIDDQILDVDVTISRCGYTGEDGFELSMEASAATKIAEALLSHEEVELAGLGARDSLRLEAGLCLYGQDMYDKTTPIEANLSWVIPKRRREEANFVGAAKVLENIKNPPSHIRVGIMPEGKAPAREGTIIEDEEGNVIGEITSGTYSPTLKKPIAMGYVERAHSNKDTEIFLNIRGKKIPAKIADMPFVPNNYYRKPT